MEQPSRKRDERPAGIGREPGMMDMFLSVAPVLAVLLGCLLLIAIMRRR
jgi:hypothetical protein